MYKVLVVDDEIWMCEGLKKIIARMEGAFTVTSSATNGRHALVQLETDFFDLVITDINMPEMNGLELMKQMKEKHYTQPVIIVTAYNDFEYARTALRFGAVDYLTKPIKNEELSEVLANLQDLLADREEEDPLEHSSANSKELPCGGELIQKVLGVIEHSYMEDLSLALLADEAGFNSSYLSRLFKMETGKGFVQYLREVRMKHACKMLEETNKTNMEVAKLVGYWDEKHFRRTFKKDFGMTPGEYREKHQSKK